MDRQKWMLRCFAGVKGACLLFLVLAFSRGVIGSDVILVFSKVDCREELQVSEEELEYCRQLNRARVKANRARFAKGNPGNAAELERQLQRTLQENELLASLSENRRKRLGELVFQFRLRRGRPMQALLGTTIKLRDTELEALSERFSELRPRVSEIKDVAAFEVAVAKLSRLFGDEGARSMLGERFASQLPAFSSVPLFREWSEFPNVEPITMLESPAIQGELKVSIAQLERIRALKKNVAPNVGEEGEDFIRLSKPSKQQEKMEKIAAEFKALVTDPELAKLSDQDRKRHIEYADRLYTKEFRLELAKETESKQERKKQSVLQSAHIREEIASILDEQQWQRLKQLVLQSAIRTQEWQRAFDIAGIELDKIDPKNKRDFEAVQLADLVDARVYSQRYDLFSEAIVSAVGETRFVGIAGKRHSFAGDSVKRTKTEPTNPRRLDSTSLDPARSK